MSASATLGCVRGEGLSAARLLKGNGVHAAVLPAGPRVYISGQGAREGDLLGAARITLERLRENLEFLGLGLSDVVQVKCFLRPASKASPVESVIRALFGGEAPPMVFVEWRNPEPIEIELIAAVKARAGNSPPPAIEYLTPPGENASPVFSRVTRLFHPSSIYLAALYSDAAGEALDQIRRSFERLNFSAQGAGSDMLHLAKAT